jgi:hypothetical protein
VRKLLVAIILSTPLVISVNGEEPDLWEAADRETVRLPPSDFLNLPKNVRSDLEARGCTIPQIDSYNGEPHNVISGHFKNSDQIDWAVLCSIERRSTILIYWAGSSELVSELSTSADKRWLQGIGDDKIGFSRSISTADAKYIAVHASSYGGEVPPVLDHEGIDDGFMEKASVVRYWFEGEWLTLQGAD